MSRVPRLLPLVAVAVGGVLALKVASGLGLAPDLLKEATAFAEQAAPGEAAKKPAKDAKKTAKAPEAKAADAKTAAPAPDPLGLGENAPAAAAPAAADAAVPAAGLAPIAPVCAPTAAELAKEAGLSPAELRVLQSLQSRRGELDARSQAIDTQMAVLAAAELKVDAKIKAFGALKDELNGMIGQADAKQDAEVTRLVTVYSKMKPDAAAAVMTQLDDRVRVPVAGKMKESVLAAILNKMAPAEAKKLTERLAARFSTNGIADKMAQAETQPSQPVAQPPAQPKAPGAPAPRRHARPRPKAKTAGKQGAATASAAAKPAPAKAAAAPGVPPSAGKVN
jgi:flagellar motility protein MotE (MotC chaperone)